jgi:hypothetical protein
MCEGRIKRMVTNVKKQIINLLIEFDEEKVVVHLEADKERFKKMIEPLLMMGIQRLNASPSPKSE